MHISEGILSPPVLLSGAALAAAGVAAGLKKLDADRIPQTAIFSAGFFVASLVHIPIGPASAHLVLNGLMGLFLGWVAFPAILTGLTLQAVLFQYGGFTTLGVNTLNMGLPAVVSFYVFRLGIKSDKPWVYMIAAFFCGSGAVLLSSLMVALSLVLTGEAFIAVSQLIVVSQIPVMAVEGLISAFCVKFIKKVKPELLEEVYA